MAGDEPGGSPPFMPDSFIWRKAGPLPVWAWMGLVLGAAVILSVWMRNRTDAPLNDPTAADGDAAGRLPYNTTAPVVWKTDIFNQITNPPGNVTVTLPQVPPGGGRPAPPAHVAEPMQSFLEVKKGWHVSQWIEDQRGVPGGNPALSWTLLEQLNPGVSANVNWFKDPSKTTFKAPAKYRVK